MTALVLRTWLSRWTTGAAASAMTGSGVAPGRWLDRDFRNAGGRTLAVGFETRPVIAAMLVRLTEIAQAAIIAIKKWAGWAEGMVYKNCSWRESSLQDCGEGRF